VKKKDVFRRGPGRAGSGEKTRGIWERESGGVVAEKNRGREGKRVRKRRGMGSIRPGELRSTSISGVEKKRKKKKSKALVARGTDLRRGGRQPAPSKGRKYIKTPYRTKTLDAKSTGKKKDSVVDKLPKGSGGRFLTGKKEGVKFDRR